MARRAGLTVALAVLALSAPPAIAADLTPLPGCGLSPGDWCPSPPGDPCGAHRDAASCRADPACFGMPYRGESVVACRFDERGFASNCPTVGCVSTPPVVGK